MNNMTCGDCKHANLYIPYFIYPYLNPKCKLTGLTVNHDDKACNRFELIGRLGR